MPKLKHILAKQITPEEQILKDALSRNIKEYRSRRNWSQFTLAAKINISTNFLADIEAGNTWVSAQTLTKLAQAFEIEAFELLKPQKERESPPIRRKTDKNKAVLSQFSQDLTVVLQESIEKAFDHVKKHYEIG
jgi:transcriptional regulator with XRE-family HTH domain